MSIEPSKRKAARREVERVAECGEPVTGPVWLTGIFTEKGLKILTFNIN